MTRKTFTLFDPVLAKPAIVDAFRKLDPQVQWRNPVMFVVYIGSIITTILWAQASGGNGEAPAGFILAVALWLWFTVLFANFAEAVAEGRGKAQADTLRKTRSETTARVRLPDGTIVDGPSHRLPFSLKARAGVRRRAGRERDPRPALGPADRLGHVALLRAEAVDDGRRGGRVAAGRRGRAARGR